MSSEKKMQEVMEMLQKSVDMLEAIKTPKMLSVEEYNEKYYSDPTRQYDVLVLMQEYAEYYHEQMS